MREGGWGGGGVVLGVRYRPCLLSLSWLEKADDSIIVVTAQNLKKKRASKYGGDGFPHMICQRPLTGDRMQSPDSPTIREFENVCVLELVF